MGKHEDGVTRVELPRAALDAITAAYAFGVEVGRAQTRGAIEVVLAKPQVTLADVRECVAKDGAK